MKSKKQAEPVYYLIAIIRNGRKPLFRYIDIRKSSRVAGITKYECFTYNPYKPCGAPLDLPISGLHARPDRHNGFRRSPLTPVIDHAGNPLMHSNVIMWCKNDVYVDLEGKKVTPSSINGSLIIDLCPLSEKRADSGAKGGKQRAKHYREMQLRGE